MRPKDLEGNKHMHVACQPCQPAMKIAKITTLIAFCASRTHFVWKNIAFRPPAHVTKYCHCHEKWLFLAVPLLFLALLDCSFELPFLAWLFNWLFLKSPYSGTQLNYFWQIGEHRQPEAANLLNWVSDPIRRKSGNSTEADIDHWHIFRHLF